MEEGIKKHSGQIIYIETSGRRKYEPTHQFYYRNSYIPGARIPGYYANFDDRLIFMKRLQQS